jgi:hypothetical protein
VCRSYPRAQRLFLYRLAPPAPVVGRLRLGLRAPSCPVASAQVNLQGERSCRCLARPRLSLLILKAGGDRKQTIFQLGSLIFAFAPAAKGLGGVRLLAILRSPQSRSPSRPERWSPSVSRLVASAGKHAKRHRKGCGDAKHRTPQAVHDPPDDRAALVAAPLHNHGSALPPCVALAALNAAAVRDDLTRHPHPRRQWPALELLRKTRLAFRNGRDWSAEFVAITALLALRLVNSLQLARPTSVPRTNPQIAGSRSGRFPVLPVVL